MILGSFYNRTGDLITAKIYIDSVNINLGSDQSKCYFSDRDPIVIKCDNEDTFNEYCLTTCLINLTMRKFIPELYTDMDREVKVEVYMERDGNPANGKIYLFNGFVNPLTFDLPYAESYTSITVECQDFLSTLDNHRYKEKEVDKNGYETLIPGNINFEEALQYIGISNKDANCMKYSWLSDERFVVDFSKYFISDISLIGSEEDDLIIAGDLFKEICKYFNINAIIIPGAEPYILFFSYDTKNKKKYINYDNYATKKDTTITFTETYHKMKLTCDTEEQEDIFTGFFDDKDLSEPYGPRQKYETEYWAWGEGKNAHNGFFAMIKGESTDYDAAHKRDYWIQVKKNKNWTFSGDEAISETKDVLNSLFFVPQYLHDNPGKAAILSVGYIDYEDVKDDNSPISKIDMTNYLYISVNGKAVQTGKGFYPYNQPTKSISQELMDKWCMGDDKSGCLAHFEKVVASGVFGSADDKTKNYFLFTGNMILLPEYYINFRSNTYPEGRILNENTINMYLLNGLEVLGPLGDYYWANYHKFDTKQNGDGCLYGVSFYDIPYGADDDISVDKNGNFIDNQSKYIRGSDECNAFWDSYYQRLGLTNKYKYLPNLLLFNDNFKFNRDGYDDDVFGLCLYSSKSDKDEVSKVPVIKCKLSIGDYDVVETTYNKFEWVHKNSTYVQNCLGTREHIFTLGFNPKIGDKLLGNSHKISNNVSYTLGIDDEGTAIPIPVGLSGTVDFKILSPVCTVWEAEVCTRQPSTWHHSSWDNRTCEIMPFVKNIIISGFDCKVISDDAKRTNYDEQDLIYMLSDDIEGLGTLGIKDDLEFKFCTGLTTEQAIEANLNAGPKKNTVMIEKTISYGSKNLYPFTGYDGNTADKPEIRYLKSKYEEYNKPRLIVTGTVQDYPNFFLNYRLGPSFSKTGQKQKIVMPLDYEYDVKQNWTKYKFKECWINYNPEEGYESIQKATNNTINYTTNWSALDVSKLSTNNNKVISNIWDSQSKQGTIIFEKDITSIPANAFNYWNSSNPLSTYQSCNNLKEIVLPNTITEIGMYAFAHCNGLERINIPNKLKTISASCFESCTSLNEFIIPDSVLVIAQSAFEAASFRRFVMGRGVKEIYMKAFYGCHITELNIYDTLENVGSDVFSNITNSTGKLYLESNKWVSLFGRNRWFLNWTVYVGGSKIEWV